MDQKVSTSLAQILHVVATPVKWIPQVFQVNSMLIYVIGRVNAPGKFVLNSNVTVLQALAMAGGMWWWCRRGKG